ncbi:MAG: DUF6259 domain-containing protein [Fermentimonas sp.]
MIKNGILFLFLSLVSMSALAKDIYELSANESTLKLNSKGELIGLKLKGESSFVNYDVGSLWEIVLQQLSDTNAIGKKVRFDAHYSLSKIEKKSQGFVISYDRLHDKHTIYDISLKIEISVKDQSFVFNYELLNNEKNWIVKEMRCPVLEIDNSNRTYDLIWGADAGRKIRNVHGDYTLRFPNSLSMQFAILDAKDHGLYIGSHDESFQTTFLKFYRNNVKNSMLLETSIVKFPNLEYGCQWKSAPLIIMPYRGSWHFPAKYYKNWASKWYSPVKKPSWVEDITGWQLAIMKQQNGEIIWNYNEINTLVELGKKNNLNVIGLFGWTSGGHDRGYPVYKADEAMGGEEVLRDEIAKAQRKGIKIILYVNGQLQDVLDEFYLKEGKFMASVSERGEPYLEMWHKFSDAPPRVHAYGCPSSDGWFNVLLSLAKQVNDLGANGIIFDQIGSPRPHFCYSKMHNHENPSLAIIPGIMENLEKIQAEMHKINPDFIIMTEHITDGIQQYIDLTHGSGGAHLPAIYNWDFNSSMEKYLGEAFPELIRYIFPDLLFTQRHQAPIMDRFSVNLGLFYGIPAELEYRYYPEKLYVLDGIIPSYKDLEGTDGRYYYLQNINRSKSNDYLEKAMDFVIHNKEFLRKGTFTDDEFIVNGNRFIKMAGFDLPDKFGIMIWNPTSQFQTPRFDLKINADIVGVSSPENSSSFPEEPLPPNSVRLIKYLKR